MATKYLGSAALEKLCELMKSAIATLEEALNGKVDKEDGKGLSTNDFTTTEKTKLSGIAESANKYTLPTAAKGTLGGVKTTSTVTSSSGYTAVPIVNGVPYYKNTTYSAATTSVNGLMTASDKSKLDGIDSGAEVNTIETIKVNNTAQTITSKTVNITVPTVTSALTNDSGFITQSTLNNYVSSNELSSTLDDYATTTVTDALGTRITALEQNSGSSSGSSTGTANTLDITFNTINITETNQLVISSPSSFAEILFYWNAGYKLTISGEVWLDKDDSNNGTKLIINHAPMSPMTQYVESNNPITLCFCFGGVIYSLNSGTPTNWAIKIEMPSQDIENSFAEIQLETVTY